MTLTRTSQESNKSRISRLIDILLTAEDDELTPTMKLKRSFVEEKHVGLIAEMY